MPVNILMPALSPTMEKGNLTRWLKKEGDKIRSGDILAEIETDKATMEVEAVDEGVLAKIVVPDGTADVPVNDIIGVIAGEGEDAGSVAALGASPQPSSLAAPIAASRQEEHVETASTPTPEAARNGQSGPRIFASPLARRIAKDSGLDLAALKGSGPHGRIIERDVKAALAQASAPPSVREARAPFAPLIAPSASDEIIRSYFAPGSL